MRVFTGLVLSASLLSSVYADTKVEKLESRKEKIEEAKTKADVRIQRVGIQAKRLDKETERLISNILKLFQSARDSKDTSTKVLRHKKQLIEGLKENARLYNKVKEEVDAQLKITGVDYGQELVKFHKWLNDRITKRITQITEMTKSFDNFQDKYDENNRDDDYRKERNNAKKGEREKGRIVKEMNEAIEKIRKEIKGLEDEMNSMESSREVKVLSLEIETAHKNIEKLESSIQEILSEQNSTKKIGKEAERNISQQLTLNSVKLKTNMRAMVSHLNTIVKLAKYRAKLRYEGKKVDHHLKKAE